MGLELTVHDLKMKYDSSPILDGIDFSIAPGEMIALLGPNGAGKSTLLRCISKMLEPTGGTVYLSGKDIAEFSSGEIARKLAIVPQDTGVDFDFTVEEVVRMGRYPFLSRFQKEGADDEQIIRAAMKKTGILPLKQRSVVSLSGGERQRMVFARALCQEPKLLLLDEPTANLDIGYQWELLKTAAELNCEQGVTVIAAIHDLNLAALFFRRFILLSEGKVLSLGTVEEVLTEQNIRNTYGVSVSVFRHPLNGRLQVSVNEKGTVFKKEALESRKRGIRVHVVGGGREAIPILEILRDKGYELSLGPVSREDSGYLFASYFRIPVIEVPPFGDITDEIHADHIRMIKEAAAIVLPPIPFGLGNIRNLMAIEESFSTGSLILLIEKNDEERDFTGGKARVILEKLKRKGVPSFTDIKEAVDKIEAHIVGDGSLFDNAPRIRCGSCPD